MRSNQPNGRNAKLNNTVAGGFMTKGEKHVGKLQPLNHLRNKNDQQTSRNFSKHQESRTLEMEQPSTTERAVYEEVSTVTNEDGTSPVGTAAEALPAIAAVAERKTSTAPE